VDWRVGKIFAMMLDMEKPSRDFKGIWIPKDIWLSDQLSLMEKVLFVEIHSLDNERGCFAGNRYFAEFFGLHPRRIAGHIASLKQKGFISVTIHNLNERVIRTVGRYARVPDVEVRRLQDDRIRLIHKLKLGGKGGMTKTS
jgi:hypothetical protein